MRPEYCMMLPCRKQATKTLRMHWNHAPLATELELCDQHAEWLTSKEQYGEITIDSLRDRHRT